MKHIIFYVTIFLLAHTSFAEVHVARLYMAANGEESYDLTTHLITSAEYGSDYFRFSYFRNNMPIAVVMLSSQGEGDTLRHYQMSYMDFPPPGVNDFTLDITAVDTAGEEDLLFGQLPLGHAPAFVSAFEAEQEDQNVSVAFTVTRDDISPSNCRIERREMSQWTFDVIAQFTMPAAGTLDSVIIDSTAESGRTYQYSIFGFIEYWNEWGIPTGIACQMRADTAYYFVSAADAPWVPLNMNLSVYPNPFNNGATIDFTLPNAGHARLAVVDILGRHVAMLHDRVANPGANRISFDGSALASGVYFLQLEANGFVDSKKMLLMK